jgi:two-component system response regulator FixJ
MTDIKKKKHIFFLDDELEVREAVTETLQQSDYEVSHFADGAECLEELHSKKCDLLITDLKMPEMNGIDLLIEVKRLAPWIPVLVITGYGDIPTAVKAVKSGAVDFIEKPLDRESFLNKVSSILLENASEPSLTNIPLTKSERKILKMVIGGKSNKEIALLLHRSIRTVEVHRARLMHKLKADNLVDLVKRAVTLGLIELPVKKKRGETAKKNDEKL